MLGRVIGQDGYLKAATYVASRLREAGVAPAFYEAGASLDGYFHEFDIEMESIREPARSSITPTGPGTVRTYNVVGIVPGADAERRREIILVGAHLDHVGWPDGQEIYNGASDNASGVATVLEVAARVAANPAPQTVLFAFYGAEEVGLKGSQAFAELMLDGAEADIRAKVNVDDIGHLGTGSAGRPRIGVLHGGLDCPDLIDRVRGIGDDVGLAVTDVDRKNSFPRSDHYSFFRAGMPVLFVTSGETYDQYHQPSDIASTLDYAQLARVSDLLNGIVHAVTENEASCSVLRR